MPAVSDEWSADHSSDAWKHYFEEHVVAEVTVPCNDGTVIVRPYDSNKKPSNKLRTNEYTIGNIFGNKEVYSSLHNPYFYYKRNQHVTEALNHNLNEECTSGLHFFLDKYSAENYR